MPNYEAVRVQTVFSRQPIRGYILKKNIQIKLIAASIAMAASFQAYAGLGGLDVRSNLDEPFSGNIAVTGEEAKALLNGGSVTVSEKGMTAKVRKLGNKAVITVSSSPRSCFGIPS